MGLMVERSGDVFFFVLVDVDILSVTIHVRFSGHEDVLLRLRKVSLKAIILG